MTDNNRNDFKVTDNDVIKQLKQELDISGELFYKQIEDDYLVIYFESPRYVTKVVMGLDTLGAAIICNDFSIIKDTAYTTKFVREVK